MNNHKISAVIPYCSNDHKFFIECIAPIYSICEKIVICVGDKFWSGLPENPEKLRELRTYISLHKKLILKEFEVTTEHNAWYWEDYSRKQGMAELFNDDLDYVLFLDCDEIINTKRMIEWLDEGHYKNYDTIQIANYWYWREKYFQSTTIETGPITLMKFEKVWEWYNFPGVIQGRAIFGHFLEGAKHKDGKPFAHHYSWVRTKEEMLAKTSAWCEHADRDWKKLIDDEFSKDFNPETGRDFVHNREFINIGGNKK